MDKHFCLRHRPTADGDDSVTSALKASTALQSISPTSPHYDTMSQILTLFSHLPNNHLRNGVLDGILDHCCLPQLSYLATRLGDVLRIDVVGNLPTEVALRVLMYLDAKSLCHAAQVCKKWKRLADDDIIWHRMCEQHIDKKCTKCGWGLPLLSSRKRKRVQTSPSPPTSAPAPSLSTPTSSLPTPHRPPKRLKRWKEIYAERLLISRNWRRCHYILRELPGHTDSIMSLHYDEALSLLCTSSYDYSIRLWNTDTWSCIKVLTGHTRCVRAVQFDDMKLVSASMDKTLKIWSMKTFECIRTLQGHDAGIVCLHFLSHLLASGSVDGTVRIWNITTGCCYSIAAHSTWVNKVLLLDANRLLTCSDDTTVKMFDLTTRAPIKTFAGHVAQVQCIQVLVPHSPPIIDNVPYPHGVLLTASLDNTLKLFSLQTGECIKTLFGHLAGVWSCAIDTLRIVSGSQDRSVKIWEVSGEGCVTLTGHNGAVNCVSVSDRCVVTGGEDGVVRVWDFGVRGLPASGENVKVDANGTALANTATSGNTNAPGIVQNGSHTNANEESGG